MISQWLLNNWLSIALALFGMWITFALRPHPRLRYWAISDQIGGIYSPSATRTKLILRNVGNEPIYANQWRLALTVECAEGILDIHTAGVSNPDIVVTAHIKERPSKAVPLQLSQLDPGDEVQLEIQHGKIREAPQVYGQLWGHHDSVVQSLTITQRLPALPVLLGALAFSYFELASIIWLAQSRLTLGGVFKGILFAFASTLVYIAIAPFFGRAKFKLSISWWFESPRFVQYALFVPTALGVPAYITAWLAGYRLWYLPLGIYVVLILIVERVIVGLPFTAGNGLFHLPQQGRSAATVILVASGLMPTIFAAFVAAGVSGSAIVIAGMICILASTLVRIDNEQIKERLSIALRNPRSHLSRPPPSG